MHPGRVESQGPHVFPPQLPTGDFLRNRCKAGLAGHPKVASIHPWALPSPAAPLWSSDPSSFNGTDLDGPPKASAQLRVHQTLWDTHDPHPGSQPGPLWVPQTRAEPSTGGRAVGCHLGLFSTPWSLTGVPTAPPSPALSLRSPHGLMIPHPAMSLSLSLCLFLCPSNSVSAPSILQVPHWAEQSLMIHVSLWAGMTGTRPAEKVTPQFTHRASGQRGGRAPSAGPVRPRPVRPVAAQTGLGRF